MAAIFSSVSGHSDGGLAITALPAAKRRGRFVRIQLDRIVEGDDRCHDAERLAYGERQMAFIAGHGIHRDDAAKHALGFFAKSSEDARRHADFVARLLDRFAVFFRQQFAQVIQIVFDGIGNAEQDSGALVSGQFADRRLPCCAASTACVASSRVPRGTVSITAPVAGLHTSKRCRSEDSTH